MNNKKIENQEELNKPELERVDNEGNPSANESEIVILLWIIFSLVVFIFMGYMLYTMNMNEKAYAKREKQELVIEKKREFLAEEFAKKNENYLSEFGYVYDFKQHLAYLSEEEMDDYTKRIMSSGWNGEMPSSTTIHIKENWNNSTEQKKDLIQLIQALKQHNVVSTKIIYNGTNRLKNVPSNWFVFETKKYDSDESLSFLEDINTINDLNKLDTIKSGLAVETYNFSDGTSGTGEGNYEYTRFNGDKIE